MVTKGSMVILPFGHYYISRLPLKGTMRRGEWSNLRLDVCGCYCGQHFLNLVLNCCVSGPKLVRGSVN